MGIKVQGNQTTITEFILLGFQTFPEVKILLFLLFLLIYIATVAGNILVLVLVVSDQNLHTPMYFFLGNLSCLETCYSSNILPSMLASLLKKDRTISYRLCLTQYYFFGSLAATECLLLSVMAYDRYVAICCPMYYATHMSGKSCLQLAGCSWAGGLLGIIIEIWSLSQLTFCGPNHIDHFYCDLVPLLNLSCSDTQQMKMVVFTFSLIFVLMPLLLTVMSYICIITTILRIPSSIGRQKAFSTCSSHLTVVTIYYGTILIVYMFPTVNILTDFKKAIAVVYTVLTPLINPLIYTLRNKDVMVALRKAYRKCMFQQD